MVQPELQNKIENPSKEWEILNPTEPARTEIGQPSLIMNPCPPPLVPLHMAQVQSTESIEINNPKLNLKRKLSLNNKEPKTKRKIITSSDKSRKFVRVNQMHQETMVTLTNIEKHLAAMSSSQATIANCIEKYVNHLYNQ